VLPKADLDLTASRNIRANDAVSRLTVAGDAFALPKDGKPTDQRSLRPTAVPAHAIEPWASTNVFKDKSQNLSAPSVLGNAGVRCSYRARELLGFSARTLSL